MLELDNLRSDVLARLHLPVGLSTCHAQLRGPYRSMYTILYYNKIFQGSEA